MQRWTTGCTLHRMGSSTCVCMNACTFVCLAKRRSIDQYAREDDILRTWLTDHRVESFGNN